jgi:hypothetical protein
LPSYFSYYLQTSHDFFTILNGSFRGRSTVGYAFQYLKKGGGDPEWYGQREISGIGFWQGLYDHHMPVVTMVDINKSDVSSGMNWGESTGGHWA